MDGITISEEKWGKDAISAGFTVIPSHLMAINQFLPEDDRVSPTEMVVLLQVLSSWWSKERMPFPSKATIGQRAGLSPRQVQRALTGLESKGFIERQARSSSSRGRTSNQYNLDGVVTKVATAAKANPRAFKGSGKNNAVDE